MNRFLKKWIAGKLNPLARLSLTLITKFNRSDKSESVVIIGDNTDFTFLLESDHLCDETIILVVTNRYSIWKVFGKLKLSSIRKLHIVEDFGDNRFEELALQLAPYNPKAVLIQAGEFLVPVYNYLNRYFKLSGNSQKACDISLYKDVMRNTLLSAGINTIKFRRIENADDIDAIDFWPVVIKPSVSTGSSGVYLAKNSSEFQDLFLESEKSYRKTEFTQSFIAEEYIKGRQFDVEGIIENGRMIALCIVEEFYEHNLPAFDHGWFLFNVPLPNKLKKRMLETVQHALEVSEFVHGAFHCELRIDSEGMIRILEYSNRMGGGFERIILKATGHNIADIYIQSMLQEPVELSANENTYILQKYIHDPEEKAAWKSYLKQNDIPYEYSDFVFRKLIGLIVITTENWESVNMIMRDMLDHDIEKLNQSLERAPAGVCLESAAQSNTAHSVIKSYSNAQSNPIDGTAAYSDR